MILLPLLDQHGEENLNIMVVPGCWEWHLQPDMLRSQVSVGSRRSPSHASFPRPSGSLAKVLVVHCSWNCREGIQWPSEERKQIIRLNFIQFTRKDVLVKQHY
jgi:hypothetical protein